MNKGIVTTLILVLGIITVALLSTTCLIGCGGDDDVAAPEEEDVVKEEPADPTPPPPVLPAATDKDHLDEARELVKRVLGMELELVAGMQKEGKTDREIYNATNKLYKEEYGFDMEFTFELLKIHQEETPEEADLVEFTLHPLLIEYLRLRFKFPNLLKEGVIRKFRESSKEGNISINLNNPKPDFAE